MTTRTGRCECGAVTYMLSGEPLAVRICWCRDCQRIASNGTVNMLVPATSLTHAGVLAEHLRTADSGNRIIRQFCPACGTHLFSRAEATAQVRGVRVGTLDDPSSVSPQMSIWTQSAPAWACIDPAIPRSERHPPPPAPAPALD